MKPDKGTVTCMGCKATGVVHRTEADGVNLFRPPHHWYMTMVPVVQNEQPSLVVVMVCDRCMALGRVKFQQAPPPPSPPEKPLVTLG